MINKKEILKARIQLHQALQLLASTAISYFEKKEDDSHTNTEWLNNSNGLATHAFGPEKNLRLALDFAGLKYVLYDGNSTDTFALDGMTEQKAILWYKNQLQQKGLDNSVFTTDRHYEIPANPQADGAPYVLFKNEAFKKLAAYFRQAHDVMLRITKGNKNASPIRCWPHHFDIATLITLETNEDPQKIKSVGVGLSPGDDSYDQPYYYVSPWPHPDESKLQDNDLPADGFWHSNGFTSAVLLAEDYSGYHDTLIMDFLSAAINISKDLIL